VLVRKKFSRTQPLTWASAEARIGQQLRRQPNPVEHGVDQHRQSDAGWLDRRRTPRNVSPRRNQIRVRVRKTGFAEAVPIDSFNWIEDRRTIGALGNPTQMCMTTPILSHRDRDMFDVLRAHDDRVVMSAKSCSQ
jgi:hypothetical protein